MPEFRGKCTNSTVCSLAQDGRIVTTAGETRCPECNANLQPVVEETGGSLAKVTTILVWLIIAAAGVGLGWKLSRMGSSVAPDARPAEAPALPAKPATTVVSDKERQEVLKRIDQMPNVTASNKERLYYYVERAQHIQRVMSVSFPNGGTKLSEASIKKLVEESKQPDFVKQAHDPVMVFVVLGFADKKGEEKSNMQVSHDRAEHLAELLHSRCGVSNAIQTVPMGSSDLFSAQAAVENRVAEVWAVMP